MYRYVRTVYIREKNEETCTVQYWVRTCTSTVIGKYVRTVLAFPIFVHTVTDYNLDNTQTTGVRPYCMKLFPKLQSTERTNVRYVSILSTDTCTVQYWVRTSTSTVIGKYVRTVLAFPIFVHTVTDYNLDNTQTTGSSPMLHEIVP